MAPALRGRFALVELAGANGALCEWGPQMKMADLQQVAALSDQLTALRAWHTKATNRNAYRADWKCHVHLSDQSENGNSGGVAEIKFSVALDTITAEIKRVESELVALGVTL